MFTKGIQLWSVREELQRNPEACLKRIADLGFRHAEGFDLIHLNSIKPLLDKYSIEVKSSFILWSHITGRYDLAKKIQYQWMPKHYGIDYAIENALELGLDTIACGYLLPEERTNLDCYKQLADKLNSIGDKCRKVNLNLLYHNHTFEFEPLESGIVPYYYLVENTEPENLNFELDILWSELAGQNSKALILRLKNRLKQIHLKTGESVDSPLYNEKLYLPPQHDYPLGSGFVDIKNVIDLALKAGVNRYYIEQEFSENIYNSLLTSLNFLNRYATANQDLIQQTLKTENKQTF